MYAPLGMNFGNRSYAPAAAFEAKYCVDRKKTISKKNIYRLNKLQPGDLIFYKGSPNGRYKNIVHVSIYMGQESVNYFGETYDSARIIQASGTDVNQSILYNQSNVVVIGRPY